MQNSRTELSNVQSDNIESEKFASELLQLPVNNEHADGSSGPSLNTLSKSQLIKAVCALSKKIQAVEKERAMATQYITEAQATRVQQKQQEALYHELQQAHMDQSKVLMKVQKEAKRLDKYKQTILLQEQVILKMQNVMENKLYGTGNMNDGNGNKGNAQPDQIEWSPATFPTASEHIEKPISTQYSQGNLAHQQQQQVELKKALDKSIQECNDLKQQLKDATEKLPDDSSAPLNAQDLLEKLQADLAVKDIKIKALESRLQKSAQEYAKELSKLRVMLFEFEMNASLDDITASRNRTPTESARKKTTVYDTGVRVNNNSILSSPPPAAATYPNIIPNVNNIMSEVPESTSPNEKQPPIIISPSPNKSNTPLSGILSTHASASANLRVTTPATGNAMNVVREKQQSVANMQSIRSLKLLDVDDNNTSQQQQQLEQPQEEVIIGPSRTVESLVVSRNVSLKDALDVVLS